MSWYAAQNKSLNSTWFRLVVRYALQGKRPAFPQISQIS